MKVKERRRVSTDDLRKLCIDHGWFTRGNNIDWEKLLSNTRIHNITSARIFEMAKTIMHYSDPETYGTIETVMYSIGRICHSSFYVVEWR